MDDFPSNRPAGYVEYEEWIAKVDKMQPVAAKDKLLSTFNAEIQRMQTIASQDEDDPNWICFTASAGKWVPLSVDAELKATFSVDHLTKGDIESEGPAFSDWTIKTNAALLAWITKHVNYSSHRQSLYRALGRGWLFVLLSLKSSKFRWWFESVERVKAQHRQDLKEAHFLQELTNGVYFDKYLTGYNCQSEFVVCMKGFGPNTCTVHIAPLVENGASARDMTVLPCILPSDAERAKHVKRQKERLRKQAKKKEQRRLAAAEQTKEDEVVESDHEFDRLLEEFKRDGIEELTHTDSA